MRGVYTAARLMRLNPFVLLIGFILFAATLTWVLPAGRYERRLDEATGRNVVVAGTYRAVTPAPVGPFQAVTAIHKGMVNGASLLFLVFIAGGALGIVDRTGALRHGVEWLAYRLRRRERLVIPLSCVAFAAAGVVEASGKRPSRSCRCCSCWCGASGSTP